VIDEPDPYQRSYRGKKGKKHGHHHGRGHHHD
jgi:hypothetical protein